MQARNNYQCATNEYDRYQSARRQAAEPITNEKETRGCRLFFIGLAMAIINLRKYYYPTYGARLAELIYK